MDPFTSTTPLTNAERLQQWLDKDGPLLHFQSKWPGVPVDVADSIALGQYVPIPNCLRRQAE